MDAPPPLPSDSESLCRHCGACCHEKFILEDAVLITDIPCEHYDAEMRRCRVYQQRHEVNPRCLGAEAAADVGALPADCPYVRGRSGYQGAVFLRDHPEYLEPLAEDIKAIEPDS